MRVCVYNRDIFHEHVQMILFFFWLVNLHQLFSSEIRTNPIHLAEFDACSALGPRALAASKVSVGAFDVSCVTLKKANVHLLTSNRYMC